MFKTNQKWLKQFSLFVLEKVDSTNSEAKRIIFQKNSPIQFVIHAKEQTAGRGRHGRTWESLKGNLFFSIVVPRTGPLDVMTQLSFVASLAIEKTISSLFTKYKNTSPIELKWPNDLLVNNKKISGILMETAGIHNSHIIIGIGVNIENSPTLTGEYTATNLREESISFANAEFILNKIMSNFLENYYLWIAEGFMPIRQKWLKKAKGVGRIVNVKTPHTRIIGKFIDIDFRGAMRLEIANGQICTVTPEEVFFI